MDIQRSAPRGLTDHGLAPGCTRRLSENGRVGRGEHSVFSDSLLGDGFVLRQFLMVSLTTLWGLRLSSCLFKRKRGNPEDPRYVAMRKKRGESFWWMSLVTVFVLQGVIP